MPKSVTAGRNWFWVVFALLGATAIGCGSESGGASKGDTSGRGQVTDAWSDYCVATFTSDVAISDSMGGVAFTAQTGEKYLLMDYTTFVGSPEVQIAYLTSTGPDTYDVPVSGGPETFPFTSNCTLDGAVQYYAAFTDVTIYDSETLTTQLCSLPAGTSVVRDTSSMAGYESVKLSFGGPQIYNVWLNSLGSLCGGAEKGYISIPETRVLGATTWLVPVQVVMKPQ